MLTKYAVVHADDAGEQEGDEGDRRGGGRRAPVGERDHDGGVARGGGDVGALEARERRLLELAQRAVALGLLDEIRAVEARDPHRRGRREADDQQRPRAVDPAEVAADQDAQGGEHSVEGVHGDVAPHELADLGDSW